MPALVQNLISNFWKNKPQSRSVMARRNHLMLAGINHTVFLNQWGVPEIKISLDRLRGFFNLDSMSFHIDSPGEDPHTVWIYEKRDRILFFKRGKLISHFKWSEFRDKWKKPIDESGTPVIRKHSFLMATTLSLVA